MILKNWVVLNFEIMKNVNIAIFVQPITKMDFYLLRDIRCLLRQINNIEGLLHFSIKITGIFRLTISLI